MVLVSIFQCRNCKKYLALDSAILSKNGKRIPLELKTKLPHKCPDKTNQNQDSTIVSCIHCGKDVTFQDWALSKSGKKIPLHPKTFAHHRCKARPFNKNTRRRWWYEQEQKAYSERERRYREQRQYNSHQQQQYNLGRSKRYAEILGVAVDATEQQIKDAYRKKMLEFHPDRNTTMSWEESNKKAAELNEAFANFNLR